MKSISDNIRDILTFSITALLLSSLLTLSFGGCSNPEEEERHKDGGQDEDASDDDDSEEEEKQLRFIAVTFNTGAPKDQPHDKDIEDGYTSKEAEYADEYYGNGLAWVPVVDATRRFFEELSPDVAVFQELFYSGECENIPEEARKGFVCENWKQGDPTVAQIILGEGYQIMCNPGKPDKCAAVKKSFGLFSGCEKDFCLEGMEGHTVQGCGKGSRIGRAVIELVEGGEVTLVNVHGSSGMAQKDAECRKKQFEQVFVDFGGGEPAANGTINLIMGDFNTDPARFSRSDESAARLNDFIGEGKAFHFITDVGREVAPTYAGIVNIDHVASDVLVGSCVHPGATEGYAPVANMVYFDHLPAVCQVRLKAK